MDSVTQIAFGAAVGGAVAGRQAGWRAFAWGAALGTLPDLDSFIEFGSPVADFTYHRGYSHSLFVQTLLAPLIAWPLARLHRRHGVGYRRWLCLVWLVLVSHALLDAFTIYGTQLLLPFSDYPVGLGSIFIIDPLYTLPLVAGVAATLLFRRAPQRAHACNLAGIVVAIAYLGWTAAAQQWVEHHAARAITEQEMPVERMLATPTAFNSILWRIVAVGETTHWEGFHTIGTDRPVEFHRYDREPALLEGVADEWPVTRLQYFTKGFYTVEQRDDQVVITDLRMGQARFYAFAYAVAVREDGRSRPIAHRRYAYPRPGLDIVVDDLVACALGRPTRVIVC